MTANPSDAARDLDSDPTRDALSPTSDEPETPQHLPSAAATAEEREERAAQGHESEAAPDSRPAIPPVPKWVVPAVAGILAFFLLWLPFGWNAGGAVIGGIAAAAVSYAFVFRL